MSFSVGYHVARHLFKSSSSRHTIAKSMAVRMLSSESYPLPDSIKRVAGAEQFPNEYPGHNYAFNWCLNGDGVTPLNRSAFRICKPLDLKVAGLQPLQSPLKVNTAGIQIPEAGTDDLPFETYDEMTKAVKDSLTNSNHLYCPEGHVPSSRTGVRIITNSERLPPSLMAYLERAPKKEDPESQPITAYILETTNLEFMGYAIEIAEEEGSEGPIEKTVGAVVIAGKKPSVEQVAAGIELAFAGITADATEGQEKS